tara:strand:- start:268 stop:651 length:384 start_codon:yes stop_codon:yes gene_type:complete
MNPIRKWHETVKTRDFSLLDQILSEQVVFYSPVVHSPQVGKEITFIYLKAAAEVFNDPSFIYITELIHNNQACLEFKLEIEGIYINGIDLITWNDEGKITEFKVFIRPLKGIETIQNLMVSVMEKNN